MLWQANILAVLKLLRGGISQPRSDARSDLEVEGNAVEESILSRFKASLVHIGGWKCTLLPCLNVHQECRHPVFDLVRVFRESRPAVFLIDIQGS